MKFSNRIKFEYFEKKKKKETYKSKNRMIDFKNRISDYMAGIEYNSLSDK